MIEAETEGGCSTYVYSNGKNAKKMRQKCVVEGFSSINATSEFNIKVETNVSFHNLDSNLDAVSFQEKNQVFQGFVLLISG